MKKSVKGTFFFTLAFMLIFTMLIPANAMAMDSLANKAAALKQLGLFQGVSATENNFDLDRAPTRAEALVMLIRAMGKNAEALEVGGTHPFTDVPAWADKYIGYAYEKGFTKGSSATTLGTGIANSDMYLTFMLRALGYSDTAGDFAWDAPDALARAVGILPDAVNTADFLRADVVLVSWASLEADLKGGSQQMTQKLMAEGTFTEADYRNAIALIKTPEPVSVSVTSFETLKTALADKTVKTVSIDAAISANGDLTIPTGVTVTVNRGNDFHIDGTLINNGTINVMGADTIINADFINYSVLNVQQSGNFINNGAINLMPAFLEDTDDHGPVGGQLRVFGSFTNNGSVFLKAAKVNTHGGMLVVAESPFINNGIVIVDGFQTIIANTFTNNEGAVVINNTYVCTRGSGTFTNNGTLSGNPIIAE